MTQVSKYPISKEVADRIFEIFLKSFVAIKNKEEADQFITDFLTPTEKIMLAKRLAIAFLLGKGYDYRTIQRIIRVSTSTIASVNLVRSHGSEGYKKLIAKILREESVKHFLEDAATKLLSIPAASTKGGGAYRYLKQELEKNKRKRTSW